MKYYIYAHSNDKYGVFYIGKGSGKRLYVTNKRSDYWKRITSRYGYTVSILHECDCEKEAFEKEIYYIALYKKEGQCVANFTNGGDGVRVDKHWWGPQISKALMGIERPKGVVSLCYKHFASYEDLHKDYAVDGLSIVALADKYKVSTTSIWSRLKQLGIPIRDINARGKRIVCTTDGKCHESVKAAARFYGLHRENIRKVLAGKYKTTGNLHFAYKEEV